MAKTYYSVIKTSFNSSRETWDEAKAREYAYIITEGLSEGTFFPESTIHGSVFETKEEAMRASSDVRDYARYERSNRRYGYASYKDRIWVHEVISKNGHNGVYLPTVGEIKKRMEYIASTLREKVRNDYIDWTLAHDGWTPAQVRNELIEKYLSE